MKNKQTDIINIIRMEKKSQLRSTFILQKLSSLLMFSGKKKLVLKMVLKSLQSYEDSVPLKKNFSGSKALKNTCLITGIVYRIKPILETRKVRKGSRHYDTPFLITKKRSLSTLLRWLAQSIRKQSRNGSHLTTGFKNEIKDLLNGVGLTIKESKALQAKVSTNFIYSHYRWR